MQVLWIIGGVIVCAGIAWFAWVLAPLENHRFKNRCPHCERHRPGHGWRGGPR